MNSAMKASLPGTRGSVLVRLPLAGAMGLLVGAGLHASPAQAVDPPPPRWAAAHYAAAVASFRQGRFPEAYGRFLVIAEWGYAPAARHALWMCENGQELFGRPFDCTPQEIEAWAILTGRDPVEALRRIHPTLAREAAVARLRR